MVKRGSSCLAWHPISQKKRGDVVSPQRNSSAQSKVGGISADPNQNEGEEADNASVVGKCRRISGHSQPQRVTAHFIRNGNLRGKDGCATQCIAGLQGSIADSQRNSRHIAVGRCANSSLGQLGCSLAYDAIIKASTLLVTIQAAEQWARYPQDQADLEPAVAARQSAEAGFPSPCERASGQPLLRSRSCHPPVSATPHRAPETPL